MKYKILKSLIAVILPFYAFSGQHFEEKDKFDGKISNVFEFTFEEEAKAGFYMSFTAHNPEKNTLLLIIVTRGGVDCGENGIEIKTDKGVIHKWQTMERDLRICSAWVPLEFVKDSFTVRVPMRTRNPLIGSMNTKKLDVNKIKYN